MSIVLNYRGLILKMMAAQKAAFFMPKKKAKPIAPVFKVKPVKAKRFSVKVPKMPKFKVSKYK